MSKNIVIKDEGKYSIAEIRLLLKEFFSLCRHNELEGIYVRDIEEMEMSYNVFLKWLGAKSYIGQFGIGWEDIRKKDIRKRAITEKEINKIKSKISKDPKFEKKLLKSLWKR